MDNTQTTQQGYDDGGRMAPYVWRPHGPGYVTRAETNLRVNSWNSSPGVTLQISGQVGRADGVVVPFAYQHIPNTNRTLAQTVHPLEEGIVLCLQVVAIAGALTQGQCFVRVELIQGREGGTVSLGTIAQDYVTDTIALAYPGSVIDSPLIGPGWLHSVNQAAPAAGADITITVPANTRWRVISGLASLVTSAVVANRTVQLLMDDGATNYARASATVAQTATLTQFYELIGITLQGNNLGSVLYVPGPAGAILPAGHRIKTLTIGLDVGDQWSATELLVEEWLDI